jgi:hypothetical protein
MQYILAFAQATQPASGVNRVVVPALTLLIYGLLGPAVYLTIVVVGVELALPGGSRAREWLARRRSSTCPTTSSLATDPVFRIECVVAGFIALSTWSVVITAWLAGYLRSVHAPQLAISQYSSRHVAIFVITLLIGVLGGFLWADGMRRAATARASLAVLAISMSLAGTLLFFYLVEPGLRDMLIVLSLGIFSGELAVAARYPTFLSEGLFAELFIPPEPSSGAAAGVKDALAEEGSADYADGAWSAEQTGTGAADPQEGVGAPEAAPAAESAAATARPALGQGQGHSVGAAPAASAAASATYKLSPDSATRQLVPGEQHSSTADRRIQ